MGVKFSAQQRESQISQLCEGTIYSFSGWVDSYVNKDSRFTCVCSKHGAWRVTCNEFINKGRRCQTCGNERSGKLLVKPLHKVMSEIQKLSMESTWIFKRWNKGYENSKSEMVLTCEIHGDWLSTVTRTLHAKAGCPSCSTSGGYNKTKAGTLYLLESNDKKYMKIGVTKEINQRIYFLKRCTPFDFKLICTYQNEDGYVVADLEKLFINTFDNAGLTGFDSCSEWLNHNPDIEKWFDFLG